MPCQATPLGARSDATFSTTAVNLRQIEFSEFGSGRVGSNHLPSEL
jgi:hypothetical protein